MTPDELNELAHEIAEDDCKSLIESTTLTVVGPDGNSWYDTGIAAYDPARDALDRALKYLDADGILKRCPDNPELVGWDDDDTGETEALEEA